MLKVIQVGIGGFGRCWLETIKRNNSVATHAALVDIDEGVLKEKAEAYGVPAECCFTRLDDALDKVDADAVVCVTPPAYHREVCVKALEAGKHAITEKPLADTIEDCRAMVAAAEKTGPPPVHNPVPQYKGGCSSIPTRAAPSGA